MDVDTLVRHDLPVVMVCGNNSAWGLEKGPMQMLYGYDVVADLAPRHPLRRGGQGARRRRRDGHRPARRSAPRSTAPSPPACPTSSTSSPTSTRPTRAAPSGSDRGPARRARRRLRRRSASSRWRRTPELRRPDAEDGYVEHLRDAAGRDREAELWVAVDDGGVLGTVTFCPPGSPWRELARDDEGEFRMLAVAPAGAGPRRRARPLVRARASTTPARRGLTARGAVVDADQMAAAHRLYERLGFAAARPTGTGRPTPAST